MSDKKPTHPRVTALLNAAAAWFDFQPIGHPDSTLTYERATETLEAHIDQVTEPMMFGAEVLAMILEDDYFWEVEQVEEWCQTLGKFGYAEQRPYDPETDGDLDYEPGQTLWFFTKKMYETAAIARPNGFNNNVNGQQAFAPTPSDLPPDLVTAIETLEAESVGDMVYDIREREAEGWEGPRVTRWAKMCETISSYAKRIRAAKDQS